MEHMNKKRLTNLLVLTVITLTVGSSLAAGPIKCDASQCYITRDGMVICPESACKELPPVKGQP